MTTSRRFCAACIGVVASVVSATRAPTQAGADEIVIREQYWQELPKVYSVYLDHAGEPWFGVGAEGDVAATYAEGPHTVSGYDVMLLGDKAGRIWVQKRHRQGPARYYDGRAWHETTINPQHVRQDKSGRVFLVDESTAHVLADGKWSKQRLVDEGVESARVKSIEDARGRVWFWTEPPWPRPPEEPKFVGIRGAWCFEDGGWTRHHAATGFPADQVRHLIRLSDDRLFVVTQPKRGEQNYRIWNAAKSAVADDASIFPEGDDARQVSVRSFDDHGRYAFLAEELSRNGTSRGRGFFILEPNGKARLVDEDRKMRLFQLHQGYSAGELRVFGRMDDDPPPVPVSPDSAIAEDRHGRRYFKLWPDDGIGVLWAKYERPGDVLRLKPIEENYYGYQSLQIIQGTDGKIWDTAFGIREWVDGSWRETPVKKLPHPPWYARPSAPWQQFGEDTVLVGDGGTLAVIQVRDVYQDAFAERGAAKDPADDGGLRGSRFDPSIVAANAEAKRTGKSHWLEGRLIDHGRWTDPRPIDEFLVLNRSALARAFTARTGNPATFSLQGDGERLWAVYHGKVVHVDGDVKTELSLPDKPDRVSTCLLDRDRLLCAWRTESQQRYAIVRPGASGLVVEDFPGPSDLPPQVRGGHPSLWRTKHGTLFVSLLQDPRIPRNSDVRVWERRDGAWKSRGDLGAPLFEEADGSLWCLPNKEAGVGDSRQFRGYMVVQENATHRFPLPEYCPDGLLTPGPNGELNAAYGYWFLTLGAAKNPLERPVRMRILSHMSRQIPAYVDSRGKVVIGNWAEP